MNEVMSKVLLWISSQSINKIEILLPAGKRIPNIISMNVDTVMTMTLTKPSAKYLGITFHTKLNYKST